MVQATKTKRSTKRRSKRRRIINLRKAMFVLPNLFTLSSVFCGFYSILLSSQADEPMQLFRAALAIFFGAFFDGADGRVARLTRTQSELGMQLDSLADAVTFGVAPGILAYRWGLEALGTPGLLIAFVFTACGIVRLARFNVIANHSAEGGSMKFFIGLPIPLAAGLLVSVVMHHQLHLQEPVERSISVALLVLMLSYLMVSNVRYRTFKKVKATPVVFVVAASALLTLALIASYFQPTLAMVIFFGGYVTVGMLEEIVFYPKRRAQARKQKSQIQTDTESLA